MQKAKSDAKTVLNRLGKMAAYLSDLDDAEDNQDCFDFPLEIIRKNMNFDMSVLYKVSNIIENRLILEVVKTLDPKKLRMDLKEGRKLRLFMDNRDRRYVNEVSAFTSRRVSNINVPGMGCDIIGFVYLPESLGGAYLFGGDFCGKESSVTDYEAAGVEIMCHFLSTLLLKTQFKKKAEYDNLTGLYNSAKIKEILQTMLRRFERSSTTTACIALADIDFFKKVNDTYGHIQGDVVLKKVGDLLSESLRGVFDIAGRYGGEEFLLIFDETNETDAVSVVERLRKSIEQTPFEKVDKNGRILETEFIYITMSFGVCSYNDTQNAQSPSEWISKADAALYKAKNDGRNRTQLFKEA